MAIHTEEMKVLAKDKSLSALKLLLEHFKENYDLSSTDLITLIEDRQEEEGIPVTAFCADSLSALEIIVKYLKENKEKSYHQIARLLNRDDRTIWSTYKNSQLKHSPRLKIADYQVIIPYSAIASRKYSTLASLIIFLKDRSGYSFNEISSVLKKNYQTIYTTYRRDKKK